jgi:hypothetical protein
MKGFNLVGFEQVDGGPPSHGKDTLGFTLATSTATLMPHGLSSSIQLQRTVLFCTWFCLITEALDIVCL